MADTKVSERAGPASAIPRWSRPPTATPGAAPDGTRMDAVQLLVRDLDAMTAYYRWAVTLDVLDQSGPAVTLGRGGTPIVELRQARDLPSFDHGGAGLYHTAILFEDERRLAAAVLSMAQRAPQTFIGSADHLVSEAFYFTDPEGNGLELYHDRPSGQWNVGADGRVDMTTLPLDPNRFLRQWFDPEPGDAGVSAVVGHVHLQVGDIEQAKRFYVGVLGFDVTAELGGTALFVSAGGYHHHIGMNTWQSRGAGPRAASLGLGDVRILVPTRDDVESIEERLRGHGIAAVDDGRTLRVEDPWRTRLAIAPEIGG